MSRSGMHNGCSRSREDEKRRMNFFRIIHNFIIQNRRLELPRKFIRKFGKELLDVAVIVVPTGKMWRVELRKAEGRISFQNGWQEFMDYYSIRVGHFLVFRYDGNSRFHVLIFEMSASEIQYEYPCHTMDFEEHNHETVSSEKKNQSSDSDDPETVLISSDTEMDDEPTSFTQLKSSSNRGRDVRYSTKKVHDAPESSTVGLSSPRVNRRNEREASSKAITTAREHKSSENPFCTITMRRSYVMDKYFLNVPSDFGRAYLMQKTQNVTLRVSDERTWRVQCIFSGHHTKLSKGWKEFAVDNHLKEGDICTFELVDDSNFEVEVSIVRASQGVE